MFLVILLKRKIELNLILNNILVFWEDCKSIVHCKTDLDIDVS